MPPTCAVADRKPDDTQRVELMALVRALARQAAREVHRVPSCRAQQLYEVPADEDAPDPSRR